VWVQAILWGSTSMTCNQMPFSETTQGLPTVWLSFDLVGGSLDPDAVSTELGVAATSQHRAGDPIHLGKGRRRSNRWRITVGPRETENVDEMIVELLAMLEPATSKIPDVCERFGAEPFLTCAVEPVSWRTPTIKFPPTLIQWLADTGSAIAVDLMLWSEDETPESILKPHPG